MRQQTEVFARIAVGEGEGHGKGRQFLSVVLLVECRVVAADEYMYEVRRLRVDGGKVIYEALYYSHVLLVGEVELSVLPRFVVATTDVNT